MFCEPHLWIIFPMMFLGILILCLIFSRRRRSWSCCFPWDDRYSNSERIRKLEEEMQRLKESK